MKIVEPNFGDKITCPECGNVFIFDETCKFITTGYVCSAKCFYAGVMRYEKEKAKAAQQISNKDVEVKETTKKSKPVEVKTDTKSTDTDAETVTTEVVKKKRGRPRKNP